MTQENLYEREILSRRNFLRTGALMTASFLSLKGLEAQVVESDSSEKTPEDYGIKVNNYGLGLFLCNGWNSRKYGAVNLEDFRGINKGAEVSEIEVGKVKVMTKEPVYKRDEELYLVIYNPKRKTHDNIGIYVSEVIEEEGIKFIDGKAYEVKIKRGKMIDKKPLTKVFERNVQDDDIFYESFRRGVDMLKQTKFEEVARKGPLNLDGNHRAFSISKLKPGHYHASIEVYENRRVIGSTPTSLYFKIE